MQGGSSTRGTWKQQHGGTGGGRGRGGQRSSHAECHIVDIEQRNFKRMQCGESRFIGTVVEERERRVRGRLKVPHVDNVQATLKSKIRN